VTAIAATTEAPDILLSSSRDKSVMVWKLDLNARPSGDGDVPIGKPFKRLTGHSHIVQDVAISVDGQFALSGSWDSTLRLWDLSTGQTTRRFVGHTRDVLSVAFSADNRQIVSGSRDRKINLWNTLGQLKITINKKEGAHNDWVSCVRFSPNLQAPLIVSSGWDKTVKVWNLTNSSLRNQLDGHTQNVNTVTVSPDGSLCASGGKDGVAFLWDLKDGRNLLTLPAKDPINALCFSPIRYWLCAATTKCILIWDLETKNPVAELVLPRQKRENKEDTVKKSKALPIQCISLAWSADGKTLFAGYTDSIIRAWTVSDSVPSA